MSNRFLALIAAVSCATLAHAHPPDDFDASSSRVWTNARTGQQVEGSFLFARSGKVAIATPSGALETVALADLAGADRAEADARIASIRAINESRVEQAAAAAAPGPGTDLHRRDALWAAALQTAIARRSGASGAMQMHWYSAMEVLAEYSGDLFALLDDQVAAAAEHDARMTKRFASAHPEVALRTLPALPADVHDLDGLRTIGSLLGA